mmetsp:Transcript_1674/g.3725  ORF Transcript_1674/g.3725 Transcript_1674/m.3725 type:complete len:105 (+) Transcript_1674:80-394(+)
MIIRAGYIWDKNHGSIIVRPPQTMHNLPIRILYRSPLPRSPQAFLPPPLLGDRNPSKTNEEQTLKAVRASPPIGRAAAGGVRPIFGGICRIAERDSGGIGEGWI